MISSVRGFGRVGMAERYSVKYPQRTVLFSRSEWSLASRSSFVYLAPLLQMRLRACVERAAHWRSLFRGASVKRQGTING